MSETRIDPETGKLQFKIKIDNFPSIWVTSGYCDRCTPFGECLGLRELSEAEWNGVEKLIKEVQKPSEVKTQLEEKFELKKCTT